jgi:hypothetical protein
MLQSLSYVRDSTEVEPRHITAQFIRENTINSVYLIRIILSIKIIGKYKEREPVSGHIPLILRDLQGTFDRGVC